MVNSSLIYIAMDGLALVVTCILLVSCLYKSRTEKRISIIYGLIFSAMIITLTADLFSWVLDENKTFSSLTLAANTVGFAGCYLLVLFFSIYVKEYTGRVDKRLNSIIKIVAIVTCIGLVILILNLFYGFLFYIDSNGAFTPGRLHHLSQFLPAVEMLPITIVLCTIKGLKKSERIILLSCPLLPTIELLFEVFVMHLSLMFVCIFITIVLIYINVNISHDRELLYMQREMAKQENELNKANMTVMMSQIRPHFLYNSITSIMALCIKDSDKAVEAMADFADYLRGNLESIGFEGLIPFENELNHIETYLRLEKLRFGDKLNIEFEIDETHFTVPSLSVQPIVENAIKHGVTQRPSGGTVWIKSESDGDNSIITIKDDGVGFDNSDDFDGKVETGKIPAQHIGLNNVRKRIESMCGGRIMINSRKNYGTEVTVVIPHNRKNLEGDEFL